MFRRKKVQAADSDSGSIAASDDEEEAPKPVLKKAEAAPTSVKKVVKVVKKP